MLLSSIGTSGKIFFSKISVFVENIPKSRVNVSSSWFLHVKKILQVSFCQVEKRKPKISHQKLKQKWACRRLKCLWPQLVATMGQTESCKNMTHTEAVSEAWNKPQRRLSTVTELHFVWYMFNISMIMKTTPAVSSTWFEDKTGGQQYLVWRQNRWSAVPGL